MTLAGLSPAGVLLVRAGEPMVLRVTLARADGTPQDLTGRTFAVAFRRSRTTTPFLTVAAELSGDALSMMVPITATEASLIHGIGAAEAVSYDIVELSGNASVSRWTARVSVDVGPEFPTDEVPVWIDLPYSEATVLPSALVVIERGAIGPGTEERLLLIGKISEATPEAMEAYFVGLGEEGARPFAEAAAASEEVALAKAGEASASALAAGMSANAADGAAGRAAVSADFAATLVAGSIYANVTAGLAETTNGQRFTAYGPGLAFATLYLNNAGVAVAERTFASQEAMDAWQQSVRKDVNDIELRTSLPKTIARRGGVWPIIEDSDGNIRLWIDDSGRIGASEFAAGAKPEPLTIRGGVTVLARDADGQPTEWYDYRRAMHRRAGDMHNRPQRGPAGAVLAVVADNGIAAYIGPDGAMMEPASADAPMAFADTVDDGGGPVRQVFVSTGSADIRLTAGMIDCVGEPKIIAPGIVKYRKRGGRAATVRYFLDTISLGTIMIVLHGQSLALGTVDSGFLAAIRLPYPPDSAIQMFNGGIRAGANLAVAPPANFTSLTPAFEKYDPTPSTRGETGLVAMAVTLRRAVSAPVILSATGQGGTPYDELGPGTQAWNNMLYAIARGKALSGDPNFSVPVLYWRQGENNEADSAASYLANLTSVADAAQIDIPAAAGAGQTVPPLVLLQQINYSRRRDDTGMYAICGPGEAAAMAALNDPRFLMAHPQYVCDFTGSYHMTPESYALSGSYAAKMLRNYLLGRRMRALHQAQVLLDGRWMISRMAGGTLDYGGRLFVDTRRVTDPGQLGYAYADDAMSAAVVSAEQISDTEFAVRLSATPTGANKRLGLAHWAPWATTILVTGPTTGLRSPIHDDDAEGCPVTGLPLFNYPISQARGVS
ncbi:hypothetical protein ACFOKF_16610 [Sphingobium rhizovicinum]|uniref:Sialate O-acetylesterase domain-containing protein n=1 Tax=Sphingobium rhizovicinum TaxID=432308 RepID=A0ABV7NK21_9SPHN